MRFVPWLILAATLFALAFFAGKVITFDPGAGVNPQGTTVSPPVLADSVAVAKKYWASQGVRVPCGKISGLVVGHIPNFQRIDPDGGARKGVCEILLRRGWYVKAVNSPLRFCALVLHETGHIIGLDHSADRANVMHTPQFFVPRACLVLR